MSDNSEFIAASCSGKVRFATHAAAHHVQKRRSKHDRDRSSQEVYRCGVCQGWHIGRKGRERPKHEFRRYLREYR